MNSAAPPAKKKEEDPGTANHTLWHAHIISVMTDDKPEFHHLLYMGLTFWFAFLVGMWLGWSPVLRILVAVAFVPTILVPLYGIRWYVLRKRAAAAPEGIAPPAAGSLAGNLVGFMGIGVPVTAINLFCFFMQDEAAWETVNWSPTTMPEVIAVLWAAAAACWFWVGVYLAALLHDWRGAAVAAVGCGLGAVGCMVNLVWLVNCYAAWGPPRLIVGD
jgi:hypothetical protein